MPSFPANIRRSRSKSGRSLARQKARDLSPNDSAPPSVANDGLLSTARDQNQPTVDGRKSRNLRSRSPVISSRENSREINKSKRSFQNRLNSRSLSLDYSQDFKATTTNYLSKSRDSLLTTSSRPRSYERVPSFDARQEERRLRNHLMEKYRDGMSYENSDNSRQSSTDSSHKVAAGGASPKKQSSLEFKTAVKIRPEVTPIQTRSFDKSGRRCDVNKNKKKGFLAKTLDAITKTKK